MPQEEALTPPRTAALDDVVEAAVRAVRAAGSSAPRVVVDGRSGAGKTTAARAIADRTGARLVSLDEFYPGWSGLEEGSRIAAELVARHAAGLTGSYRRWDWDRGAWHGDAIEVDPRVALVIEGCGALTPDTARVAACAVWLDGPEPLRRERAFERDGEGFVPFWDMWAAQEDAHIRAHAPARHATIAADVG